jgi:hypothetical protein
MGVSISRNTVNSMIQSSIDVTNNFATICTSTNQEANSTINVKDCKLSNDTILLNSAAVVSLSCLQNASIQASLTNSVQQNIIQQAQAISASFGFPTVEDAENFLNTSLNLADVISNTFNSQCAVEGTSSKSTFSCDGSQISGTIIEINSFAQVSQNCIFNQIVNTEAANKVVQALQNSSLAKETDTFSALLYGFIILIAIFAWMAVRFSETPVVQIGVVVIILVVIISSLVYAYTARTRGAYPYKKA